MCISLSSPQTEAMTGAPVLINGRVVDSTNINGMHLTVLSDDFGKYFHMRGSTARANLV